MSTTGTTSSGEDDDSQLPVANIDSFASGAPDASTKQEAIKTLPLRFTLGHGDLEQAWQRTRLARSGTEITLVLSDSELILKTSNESMHAHASLDLIEPAGLPTGAVVNIVMDTDLFEGQLCSGRLHGISAYKEAGSDHVTFESVEELTLGSTQSAKTDFLRIKDGHHTATWPCTARMFESAVRENVPETAVSFSAKKLARALDLGRRLMVPREDRWSRLTLVNGVCQATSRLGVCFVRLNNFAELDLDIAPENLAPLVHLLDSQNVEGLSWLAGDRHILRFGGHGCDIDRSGRPSRLVESLLDQSSHAAASIKASDFYERWPGLLKQPSGQIADASIALSGGPAPTLSISVVVPGGQAELSLTVAWVSGVPQLTTGDVVVGRASIAALIGLTNGRTGSGQIELHLHATSLELREVTPEGALRAFIPFSKSERNHSLTDAIESL